MKILAVHTALLQAAIVAACLLPAGVGEAAPPAPPAKVSEPRYPGDLAAQRGTDHEAIALWLQEWAKEPSAVVACNIGRAELRVGTYPNAAKWLTRCLRLFPDNRTRETVEFFVKASDELQAAKEKVSALSFNAEPGTEITIDSEIVVKTPLLEDVFILPGKHHINALKDGRSKSLDQTTEAGKDYTLDAMIPQDPPPPAPKADVMMPGSSFVGPSLSYLPSAVPLPSGWWIHVPMDDGKVPWWVYPRGNLPREEPPGAFRMWPVVVGGTLTGAALATSITFGVMAANATEPRDQRTYDTAKYFSLVGFGLFLGATATYAFYEDRRTSLTFSGNRLSWSHKW